MGQLMITVQPKAPRAEITITSGAVTHTVYVDSQGSVIPGVPGGVPGPTTVSGGASSIDTGVSTAPTGVLTPTLTSSVRTLLRLPPSWVVRVFRGFDVVRMPTSAV